MIGVSATSVGKIGLDLVVNSSGFNRQMSGISGIAKKAGVALAAAFSVKAIINFSKEFIKLGSDLDEVQNVVDVTFPSMTAPRAARPPRSALPGSRAWRSCRCGCKAVTTACSARA